MALLRGHLFPSGGSLGTTDARLGGSLALPILVERHALIGHRFLSTRMNLANDQIYRQTNSRPCHCSFLRRYDHIFSGSANAGRSIRSGT
jgi:hypothetical protein